MVRRIDRPVVRATTAAVAVIAVLVGQLVFSPSASAAVGTVSIPDASVVEGDSGTTQIVFPITITTPRDGDCAISITMAADTATAADVDLPGPRVVLFGQGVNRYDFLATVHGDTANEIDETFTVTVSGDGTAPLPPCLIGDGTATGTIIDDDDTDDLSVADTTGFEGTDITFTITRATPSSTPCSVAATTFGGTATSPPDYTGGITNVTIPGGATSATFTVAAADDAVDEPDETFTVELFNVSGGCTLADSTATATIVDTDGTPPSPSTLSIADLTVTEGGQASFTITRGGFGGTVCTVSVTTVAGTATATAPADYTASSTTVTFAVGQTQRQFTVQTIDDALSENAETFVARLSNPSTNCTISDGDGTATINDNEPPPPGSLLIADATTEERFLGITFEVTRTGDTSAPCSFFYVLTDGTATGDDYDNRVNFLPTTFQAGQSSVFIGARVIEDAIEEGDETFTVTLINPTGCTISDGTATGTIEANDTPVEPAVMSIGDTTVTEGADATFTVTRSGNLTFECLVSVQTADGSATSPADYDRLISRTLRFVPGQTSATVTVPTVDDTSDESNETFDLEFVTNYCEAGDDSGTATIVDADAAIPAAGAFAVADTSTTEGDALVVTVTRVGGSAGTCTVLVSTANGTATDPADFDGGATTVTFGDGVTSRTVTIPTVEDAVDETNETLTIALSGAAGGCIVSTGPATGTIVDDDGVADPTIAVENTTTEENYRGIYFTVRRSGNLSTPCSFSATTSDGTATSPADYQSITTLFPFTFAAGADQTSFTILVVDDIVEEPDETLSVQIFDAQGCTITDDTATGTILANDVAEEPTVLTIGDVTVDEGGDAVFNVTRTGNTRYECILSLRTTDGSALSPADYAGLPAITVRMLPGVGLAQVTIPTVDDAADEGDETFTIGVVVNLCNSNDDTATATIVDTDDPPPSAGSLAMAPASTTEGDDLVFTITRLGGSAGVCTVTATTADGTAVDPADYDGGTATVTFADGVTTRTVALPTIQDTDDEPNETLTLTLSDPTGGCIVTTGPQVGTIVDDDGTAAPTLSIGDTTTEERFLGIAFTIRRSGDLSGTCTVLYATFDGTATSPADYTKATAVFPLTLPPGAEETGLNIPVINDGLSEPPETLTFQIFSPSGGCTITDGEAVGTILADPIDDTPPPPPTQVSIGDTAVTEGDDAVFTLTRTNDISFPCSVAVGTINGTAVAPGDYTAITATIVTFAAGASSAEVTVATVDDAVTESEESFTARIISASPGCQIGDGTGTGLLDDNDQPASFLSISDAEDFEGRELVFTLTRSEGLDRTCSVTVSRVFGTATAADFIAAPAVELIFAPTGTELTYRVATIDDTTYEGGENFTLELSSTTPGCEIGDGSGTGIIFDNDRPPPPPSSLAIEDTSTNEGDDMVFRITRTGELQNDCVFTVTTAPGTASNADFGGADLLVFMPAGDGSSDVMISTVQDTLAEGDESFTLTLSNPSPNCTIIGAVGTGTIIDDEPTVAVADTSTTEGQNMVFTITRSGDTSGTCTVSIGTSDGTASGVTDFVGAVRSLGFAPGETTLTASFPTVDDTTDEPNETFTAQLANAVGCGITHNLATGTIVDNDEPPPPPPTLAIADATVTEGGTLVFTVTRSGELATTCGFSYSTQAGSAQETIDFTPVTSSATIGGGATTTVSVATVDDSFFESSETLTVTISVTSGACTTTDPTATGTITDNEPTPVGSFAISDASTTEGGNLVFTLSRAFTSVECSVTATVLDITATAPGDYTFGAQQFTVSLPAGVDQTTLVFPTVDDTLDEADETILLRIESPTNGCTVADRDGRGTIVDNDDPPVVSEISIADISVAEGTALSFPLTRTNPAAPCTVTITITAGTATEIEDYFPGAGSFPVTFAAGDADTTAIFTTVNDAIDEPNETVTVTLSDPTAGCALADPSATGTLVDDDEPGQGAFSVTDATATEGDALAFTITRTSSIGACTVHVETADGTATGPADYAPGGVTLTFLAGDTAVLLTSTAIDDTLDEPTETMFVNLSAVAGGCTIADNQGVGTIEDNDETALAELSVTDASATEGSQLTFRINLGSTSTQCTFSYTMTNGTAGAGDYIQVSGTAFFPVGPAAFVTITTAAFDDTDIEPDETFSLVLSNPQGCVIADGTGTGTIVDNDTPPPPPDPVCVALDQVKLQAYLQTSTPVQPITLGAGTYEVTLTSSDPTHPDSGEFEQHTEQWYVELLGPNGNVVATSGTIGDLPAVQFTMSQGVGTVTIPPGITATGIRAVHAFPTAAYSQSVYATLACFQPQGYQPDDEWDD